VIGVSAGTWVRVATVLAIVTVVTAAFVVATRTLTNSAGSPAPSASPTQPATSVATAAPVPSSPGFPDLDGFTDVSKDHDVSGPYPLATFTSPTGLQCAMWSSRGDTAAFCFGEIPGLDRPANQVYAGDYDAYFDQDAPPAADKLGGKPLASGEKVILGAGGNLMGGNQITCGVQADQVACMLIRGFRDNRGDDTAQRHGFVLDPQGSWTF